jgi:cystathionine beta-lyase/cystathionine gamma-synthase
MVWFEPTTNPTLKIIDIKAICEITRRKDPNIIIGVDNTFSSPYYIVFLNFIPKLIIKKIYK